MMVSLNIHNSHPLRNSFDIGFVIKNLEIDQQ